MLGACTAQPSPSASEPASSVTSTERATEAPIVTEVPTPSATPALSLAAADVSDPRQVTVSATAQVAADAGGEITITVTSGAEDMIDELVLRWPTELDATLFLAPFVPDPQLVTDGGGNLVRPWTKWVVGPGEQGEPDGTTSLGYGPLEAGATLTIPLYVTRAAPGPASFDMQILAGESILTLPDGQPAELRVEVP